MNTVLGITVIIITLVLYGKSHHALKGDPAHYSANYYYSHTTGTCCY